MSDAFFERSPGNAEWARELLRNRFRVIILYLDTDATVRGGSAKSRRMHGGEVLARSSCAGLARVIRLRVSIAMFRKRISFMRLADEEKKEEALLRVLLFKCLLAESSQSTCPDVCRRGHHWLYRRKTCRHRSQ